jgi:hypothetical protein
MMSFERLTRIVASSALGEDLSHALVSCGFLRFSHQETGENKGHGDNGDNIGRHALGADDENASLSDNGPHDYGY